MDIVWSISVQYSLETTCFAAVQVLPACFPCDWQTVRYSPTFVIYKGGKKVDEVVGKDVRKLTDHLWLHHDDDVATEQRNTHGLHQAADRPALSSQPVGKEV